MRIQWLQQWGNMIRHDSAWVHNDDLPWFVMIKHYYFWFNMIQNVETSKITILSWANIFYFHGHFFFTSALCVLQNFHVIIHHSRVITIPVGSAYLVQGLRRDGDDYSEARLHWCHRPGTRPAVRALWKLGWNSWDGIFTERDSPSINYMLVGGDWNMDFIFPFSWG